MPDVVREAKLFECGNYPDRGISFSEADLDAIVSGFNDGKSRVPIRVQHTSTPFDGLMGHVESIWRVGRDLLGRLSFPDVVWAFLEKLGTKKLSVGFDFRQRRLVEVSIVENPRILTARIFGDNIADSGLLIFEDGFGSEAGGEGIAMPDTVTVTPELKRVLEAEREAGRMEGKASAEAQFSERIGPVAQENAALKRKMASDRASAVILGWKAEGRLVPAAEKFAEAILVDGAAEVTFADGGHMSAAQAFVQFMTFQGPVLTTVRGGAAPAAGPNDSVETDPVALGVYAQLGVTPEEVAAAGPVATLGKA